ncbi:hypothetical protein P8452_22086 [Trifolium repens]|nr:hypothetical protein P8452_22086 [Trifolium repens]
MLVRVLPYLHLCLSIPNTKKLHVFDFLLILYVLPDLSSLGFIEPLAVAQILLQFGPWNMANKVIAISRDMSKIFVPYVGIAVGNGLPLPAKMMCLTSVLDLTPRRNYRCSMILGH